MLFAHAFIHFLQPFMLFVRAIIPIVGNNIVIVGNDIPIVGNAIVILSATSTFCGVTPSLYETTSISRGPRLTFCQFGQNPADSPDRVETNWTVLGGSQL